MSFKSGLLQLALASSLVSVAAAEYFAKYRS
jgi:hypothetical protein